MLRERLQPWIDWLRRAVERPRDELTRWQTAARFAYDLVRHGTRQLKEDRAPQMAAALAFRTLFALLPVIVVSTVVFQGLRGVDRLQELVRDLAQGAGLDEIEIVGVTGPEAQQNAVEETEPTSLAAWLEDLVAQVGQINLETLGWVGLAVMVYAAIAMMVTIENAFNTVYRAPGGRSWPQRLVTYWAVLTIGPLAIGLLFYMEGRFAEAVVDLGVWSWVVTGVSMVWSLALIWLVMLGVYVLIPNTRVGWRPAMIGSFVAALLVQVGKTSLVAYFNNAMTLGYIYGTIGLVPILMLWTYIMWLFVLFGLEVSATLQSLGGRKLDEMEQRRPSTGVVDPASVIAMMQVIAERFRDSAPTSTRQIAEESSVPEPLVTLMIDRLINEGLLHRVQSDESLVTLACPPDQIAAERLLEIGHSLADETAGQRKSEFVRKLREAQISCAAGATLASLLGPRPAVAGADQVSDPS